MIIEGIKYTICENGVLIPENLVRESRVNNCIEASNHFAPLRGMLVESVSIITLDANNGFIAYHLITKGILNSSQAHPREIFRQAILDNACSIIMAHNHPSGNLVPSESDLKITEQVYKAGKIIGISLTDHLIITVSDVVSIRSSYPGLFL